MPGLPFPNLHHQYTRHISHGVDAQTAFASMNSSSNIKAVDLINRMPLRDIVGNVKYSSNVVPTVSEPVQALRSSESNSRGLKHVSDERLVTSSFNESADSEQDLAAMVHDFIENGSNESEIPESSDGESMFLGHNSSKLFEKLQTAKLNPTPLEKELVSMLVKISLSIKEIDLNCLKPTAECTGGCIRRLIVKRLRRAGYDAAICSCKWPSSGKLPRGEYEYIDVVFGDSDNKLAERFIVDVDFRSQFEIARPTQSYAAALNCIPLMFVGPQDKLKQVLQVMADAAKLSLKQNSMPLPPWRTLEYMTAKWMSPFERTKIVETRESGVCKGRTKQCVEQLRHLKLCIAAEADKNQFVKTNADYRQSGRVVQHLAKSRRVSIDSPYSVRNELGKIKVQG